MDCASSQFLKKLGRSRSPGQGLLARQPSGQHSEEQAERRHWPLTRTPVVCFTIYGEWCPEQQGVRTCTPGLTWPGGPQNTQHFLITRKSMPHKRSRLSPLPGLHGLGIKCSVNDAPLNLRFSGIYSILCQCFALCKRCAAFFKKQTTKTVSIIKASRHHGEGRQVGAKPVWAFSQGQKRLHRS